MIDLQNQLSEESNKRDIGKVFEVLIEGFSKRSREQLFGRTSQNKVVIFDKKNYRVGQFIKVRINRASSATLFGDPVEKERGFFCRGWILFCLLPFNYGDVDS